MINGGTIEEEYTLISEAITSISPVAKFLFGTSFKLTLPLT